MAWSPAFEALNEHVRLCGPCRKMGPQVDSFTYCPAGGKLFLALRASVLKKGGRPTTRRLPKRRGK